MKKVYLVTIDAGSYDDYHWWIDSLHDSLEKAEAKVAEIKKEIDLCKLDYENVYGISLEKDRERLSNFFSSENDCEEDYDDLVRRIYGFEHDNPSVEYGNILVVEKDVL